MRRVLPAATLFPYTTLFRSRAPVPCLTQMQKVFARERSSVLAVQIVPPEETDRYGIVEVQPHGEGLGRVQRIVEKPAPARSEEHTSELQSLRHLVCRLLLEK